MIKVWVTKYALTKGIITLDCHEPGPLNREDMISIGGYDTAKGDGIEWHRTQESAAASAELMRKKRIKSINKQLKRLKSLNFRDDD